MIDAGWVAGGDGRHHPGATLDRLSAPGKGTGYRLTTDGAGALTKLGVPEAVLNTARPLRGVVPRSIQVTAEGEGGMAELLAAAQPETPA